MKTEEVHLLLGNISFDGSKAIVHKINGVFRCENIHQAKAVGELLCNEFTAYVIPVAYSGEIIIEQQFQTDW